MVSISSREDQCVCRHFLLLQDLSVGSANFCSHQDLYTSVEIANLYGCEELSVLVESLFTVENTSTCADSVNFYNYKDLCLC